MIDKHIKSTFLIKKIKQKTLRNAEGKLDILLFWSHGSKDEKLNSFQSSPKDRQT
jgi:hypothetical protein